MGSLVNIIHPHMYKVSIGDEGLIMVMGDCPEYLERDNNVKFFVKKALDYGINVLDHENYAEDFMKRIIATGVLMADSIYNFLGDGNIEKINTLPNGFPLPDERHDKISEKIWEDLEKIYINHSKMQKKIKSFSKHFFIGGAFEACLGNIATYFVDKYEIPGKDIFCVKDLSASFDEQIAKEMEKELLNRNIQIINHEEALKLLS